MSCPDCKKGSILPGEPTGTMFRIDGIYVYSAQAPGSKPSAEEGSRLDNTEALKASSKRAVVIFTDVFGLPLKNCKIIADEFAKRLQCDAYVPDLFDGRPILGLNQLELPDQFNVRRSFLDQIWFFLALIPSIPAFIHSRPSVVDQRISKFTQWLQAKKKYESLGAVGYCFGGLFSVRFAATDIFKSVVICHPGGIKLSQIKAMKVPSAWVLAEVDYSFPEPLRNKVEASLAVRKGKDNFVEHEFMIYQGTAHGFAIRPDFSVPAVKEAYEKALDQTVNWFNKTLSA